MGGERKAERRNVDGHLPVGRQPAEVEVEEGGVAVVAGGGDPHDVAADARALNGEALADNLVRQRLPRMVRMVSVNLENQLRGLGLAAGRPPYHPCIKPGQET